MNIIECKNVWKKYKYFFEVRSFKEHILGKKNTPNGKPLSDEDWTLKDVSFSVNQGEGFGIMGRNGAGKSTLLRILASILVATRGEITVKGKICPILNLGVGFLPEFTGEENIYIAATLLGKTKDEVDEILDDIIDFSELEDYIDIPVKFYSTGMLARLSFATAVHMDPDIFLVDEALTVGDIGFQKKCLERFQQLKSNGKTIVIVTHGIEALEHICERSLFLHEHRVFEEGATPSVIRTYREIMEDGSTKQKGK